jgi:YrbI family 3-deoxy-D-manno-octulosonate 8-phosphate phosphatase
MDDMVTPVQKLTKKMIRKCSRIKLVLTDSDGVLTDAGVYYSAAGEEMKKFSIRDGMGVARLREIGDIETGIITGENSTAVERRAEKLSISELHLGIRDKLSVLEEIIGRRKIDAKEIAYIGDDVNDLDVLKTVGLSACPRDGLEMVKHEVDYICQAKGGQGAFREFAEIILQGREQQEK